LFAVAEGYPELKADANFRQLSSQLAEIEDHLQYARRYHNGAVRDFNNLIQSFPNNLIASLLHFREESFFEAGGPEERSTPRIQLG
jgi:LemA protein